MDSMVLIIIPIIIVLLITLVLGAPVFTGIGFTAVCFLMLFMGTKFISQFGIIAFNQGTSANQLVAPMFILMAEFLSKGGLAEDIYYVLNKYLKKLRGGLAVSTTLACTVFAAMCGSSPATAASIGRISVKEMSKRGYNKGFAAATVAAGGTLGVMIPPSVVLVGFGILTETSIAQLLVAGLLPGLMLSALLCVSIIIRGTVKPELVGEKRKKNKLTSKLEEQMIRMQEIAEEEPNTTWKQDLGKVLPIAILIVVVFMTMYTGIATPTESAGIGVIGAFLILVFKKKVNLNLIKDAALGTSRVGVMIIFMMISGFCLTYVISYMGIATQISTAVASSGLNKWVVIIVMYIIWLILGCIMDTNAMIVLTIPFVFETLTGLGFDPLWIGVVSTLCVEIGMITPPVGLNLFVIKSTTDVSMGEILKGAIPYVGILLIGLVILTIFPQIALILPSTM